MHEAVRRGEPARPSPRAYSTAVVRRIRIAEAGVQFSLGPPFDYAHGVPPQRSSLIGVVFVYGKFCYDEAMTYLPEHADMLDVVDENDQIIGQAPRRQVHEQGLLHREVHIYGLTTNRELIFSIRGAAQDNRGLLNAMVGGHVDSGMDYMPTALKEFEEETGLVGREADLVMLDKIRVHSIRSGTNFINNVMRTIYFYVPAVHLASLRPEDASRSGGFSAWSLDSLKNISPDQRVKFIRQIIDVEVPIILDYLATHPRG